MGFTSTPVTFHSPKRFHWDREVMRSRSCSLASSRSRRAPTKNSSDVVLLLSASVDSNPSSTSSQLPNSFSRLAAVRSASQGSEMALTSATTQAGPRLKSSSRAARAKASRGASPSGRGSRSPRSSSNAAAENMRPPGAEKWWQNSRQKAVLPMPSGPQMDATRRSRKARAHSHASPILLTYCSTRFLRGQCRCLLTLCGPRAAPSVQGRSRERQPNSTNFFASCCIPLPAQRTAFWAHW
mmetsp:Transcript_101926/g.304115  ORF Transcript_101926/g.304115 Transcript_101926/m.304115 type:complete len:240 (+) Transcript_101926:293-1012(+)